MNRINLIVFIMLMLGPAAQAQEAIPAGGGEGSGSSGSISFSVGQVFYQLHETDQGSLLEGVQQPYEIFVVTSMEDVKGITLFFQAYPNPVSHQLTLQIDRELSGVSQDLSYQMVDIRGRVVEQGKIVSERSFIGMADKHPGVYLLKISDHHTELKTFRIIKN